MIFRSVTGLTAGYTLFVAYKNLLNITFHTLVSLEIIFSICGSLDKWGDT